MEIQPEELIRIIGLKEVELIYLRTELAKKEELLKALESNPAGLRTEKKSTK